MPSPFPIRYFGVQITKSVYFGKKFSCTVILYGNLYGAQYVRGPGLSTIT